MDNPGVYTLAALTITPDMPRSLLKPQEGLAGMKAVTIDVDFKRGTGGTKCIAIIATTFDEGATWRHIARFDFTTANRVAHCTLTKGSKAVTNYADLAAEGVNDGILGDQLAVLIETDGDYGNTQLAVNASVN
ncbi:MAG: hypothetical protein E6G97_25955 [Alphaproteobacteria bacterium]|nr:MAG: hypothetical protein E6G97_25955 [Alphaproteobacteria bacterium]